MNNRTMWRSNSQLDMCQVMAMTTIVSPSSVLPQSILGRIGSSGLSSLGLGLGPASGIQPNSPHPRPSPPLTRKSLSPGEG